AQKRNQCRGQLTFLFDFIGGGSESGTQLPGACDVILTMVPKLGHAPVLCISDGDMSPPPGASFDLGQSLESGAVRRPLSTKASLRCAAEPHSGNAGRPRS